MWKLLNWKIKRSLNVLNWQAKEWVKGLTSEKGEEKRKVTRIIAGEEVGKEEVEEKATGCGVAGEVRKGAAAGRSGEENTGGTIDLFLS